MTEIPTVRVPREGVRVPVLGGVRGLAAAVAEDATRRLRRNAGRRFAGRFDLDR